MAAYHYEYFHSSLNDINAICALVGGFIIIFGFFSLIVKERLYLSDTLCAMVFGIIIGPKVINLVDPRLWEDSEYKVTYAFAELVIAIQIMAAGIALPARFWRVRWKSVSILLGPIMIWMWLITSLLVWGIIGCPWLIALVIGACTAPTDPILANAIVSGRFAEKYISIPVRNLLSGESAVNDGIAVPFFMLAILLRTSSSAGAAWGIWFYRIWLYEVIAGSIIGAAIGWIAKTMLRISDTRGWIDKKSFLTVELTLAIFTLGICSMLSMASFLSVFICSIVFSWDGWFAKEAGEAHAQEVIDNILNLSFFIYFGASIPWNLFNSAELPIWRLFVLAICVFLIRRVPAVLVLSRFMPSLYSFNEALLVGWFGPIGVGAIWYMAESQEMLGEVEVIPAVVYFIVFISVIVFGITAPFLHLTIRTISTIATKTHELKVPQWPSNVPMTANAISGPQLLEPILNVGKDRDYEHTASILVKRPNNDPLPIPSFEPPSSNEDNVSYCSSECEENIDGSQEEHKNSKLTFSVENNSLDNTGTETKKHVLPTVIVINHSDDDEISLSEVAQQPELDRIPTTESQNSSYSSKKIVGLLDNSNYITPSKKKNDVDSPYLKTEAAGGDKLPSVSFIEPEMTQIPRTEKQSWRAYNKNRNRSTSVGPSEKHDDVTGGENPDDKDDTLFSLPGLPLFKSFSTDARNSSNSNSGILNFTSFGLNKDSKKG